MAGLRGQSGTDSAPTGRSTRWHLARVLALVVIALGLLNFIWGFLPELSLPRSTTTQGNLSVFSIGPAYVPILLLTAGLLAMTAFLPDEERSRFAVAAVSAGGAIGGIVSLGTQDAVSGFGQVSKGLGAILLVIFGIIQAVVALTAFVIGSGFVMTPSTGGQSLRDSGPGDQAQAGAVPTADRAAGAPTAQPYPGQPYPGQPYPGQPYPGQPYPGQPYPGQPYPGQPYPGQPKPRQGWPAPGAPRSAAADLPADGPAGWGRAPYGPAPAPQAHEAGTADAAASEPSRSSIPPSADARSDDTDPHGIPAIDPAGPTAAEPDAAVTELPSPAPPVSAQPSPAPPVPAPRVPAPPAPVQPASVQTSPRPPTSPSASVARVPPTDRLMPGPRQPPGDNRRPWDSSAGQDPSHGS